MTYDLKGKRFGRLLVIGAGTKVKSCLGWICLCDCGKTTNVGSNYLTSGKTRSCGCLHREVLLALNTKHGDSKKSGVSRIYTIWSQMRDRCQNENALAFKNYGGRGISVCKEWSDYIVFKLWAESHGYADNLEIDRIDNNAGYSPENCRWVTPQENCQNTRNTILTADVVVEIRAAHKAGGVSLSELASRFGTSKQQIWRVIHRRSWSNVA